MKGVELLLEQMLWHVVVEPAALKPALLVAVTHELVDTMRCEGAEDYEQDDHRRTGSMQSVCHALPPAPRIRTENWNGFHHTDSLCLSFFAHS